MTRPVALARGTGQLVVDATVGLTDVVEALHVEIAAGPTILRRPWEMPARVLLAPTYAAVRGGARLVGAGFDLALRELARLLDEDATTGAERYAVVGVLNGVVGDHLADSGNPLAIPMTLRGDRGSSRRIVVFVHGSSLTDACWGPAATAGADAVYVHYNTGRHISTNGQELASLLEQLPDVDDIALVGHSMGGLVVRAAAHAGEVAGHRWRSKLRTLVTLGSPHHGSPVERVGQQVHRLLGINRYSAPFARVARLRSAGVTDLRYGNVLDEHWMGHDRFSSLGDRRRPLPLPEGVRCFAIAATSAPGPASRLPGDGLVPVDSALGRHAEPALQLHFTDTCVVFGARHLDLVRRDDVLERVDGWLGVPRVGGSSTFPSKVG
jgi:pimeloyl-ACP methyl ester carboxylesterase